MFESKVSSVKNEPWGSFSILNTNPNSKAPAFIPIPCPTHSEYSITNICKSPQCIEPLCPQCITGHVQLHQQTKKPAKIQNIINTRMKCIDKLAQIQEQLNLEFQKYQKSCGANVESFLQKNRKKIDFARSKVENFVKQFFQKIQQKMEHLEVAYLNQRQRKSKQLKLKMAPLEGHMQEINQYKEELQSDEYIPALIQLLNGPPKRPPALSKPNFEDYGQVSMDERAFQSFKDSLQQFLHIKNLSPDQTLLTSGLSKNNGRFSNQMQFSRLGRSSSRQLVESKLSRNNSTDSRVSRQNSRKKIFSKDKIEQGSRINRSSVSYQPITQKHSQKQLNIKIQFEADLASVSDIDLNYFKYDKGLLIYFPQNQQYYFSVDALCADTGFSRFQLPSQFVVPFDHKCIVTPESRVYLLGGRMDNTVSANLFQVLVKLPNRSHTPVKSLKNMIEARFKFGAVCFNQKIYVFGGRNNKEVLSCCQVYDLRTDHWEKSKDMPEPLYDTNICTYNDKIFKFGGILPSGQTLNRIDIFYPSQNYWLQVASEICFHKQMGCAQISRNKLLIFGGQTQFNTKKGECYVLQEQKANHFKLSPTEVTLHNQASFQSSYVYKNGLLAIQNGQDSKHKIIMKFSNSKWRFLAC